MEQLNNELFENTEIEKEDWKIKDVGSADWALSKIKAIESNYQSQLNYLTGIIEKAKGMKTEIENKMRDETIFYANALKEWTADTIKNQKSKTINLLNGSLSIRKTPAKVEIFDETKTLSFCIDKNLNVKFICSLDCNSDEVAEIMGLTEKFHKRMKSSLFPLKTSISDYFKSKKVDSADFPGGTFSASGESFNIK